MAVAEGWGLACWRANGLRPLTDGSTNSATIAGCFPVGPFAGASIGLFTSRTGVAASRRFILHLRVYAVIRPVSGSHKKGQPVGCPSCIRQINWQKYRTDQSDQSLRYAVSFSLLFSVAPAFCSQKSAFLIPSFAGLKVYLVTPALR